MSASLTAAEEIVCRFSPSANCNADILRANAKRSAADGTPDGNRLSNSEARAPERTSIHRERFRAAETVFTPAARLEISASRVVNKMSAAPAIPRRARAAKNSAESADAAARDGANTDAPTAGGTADSSRPKRDTSHSASAAATKCTIPSTLSGARAISRRFARAESVLLDSPAAGIQITSG